MGSLCLRLILSVTKWLFNDQHGTRSIVFPEVSIYKRNSFLSLSGSKNIYKAAKKLFIVIKTYLFFGSNTVTIINQVERY